ncbi:hypothetical protein GQX74_004700 [Glossina fuscipes]|nr:hypothetical protein GQX74_004700 [Glossina fuscipes]
MTTQAVQQPFQNLLCLPNSSNTLNGNTGNYNGLWLMVVESRLANSLTLGVSGCVHQTFYVLQCPHPTAYSIPRPSEMSICAIVGRYQELIKQKDNNVVDNERKRDMQQLPPFIITIKPKKKKLLKVVTIKKVKPQIHIMRPKELRENVEEIKPRRRQHEPLHDQQIQISNLRPVKILDGMNEPIKELVNASTDYPIKHMLDEHYQDDGDNERIDNSEEFDFVDIPEDTSSPLRFLTARNALSKLKLEKPIDIFPDDSYGNSEKFFAELNDFGRGFHTKGYHNMYHRDEILNDHIIYDDLQQNGNYKHKQKIKEKF